MSDRASLTGYTDSGAVSAYAQVSMAWAVQAGILSGMGSGQLSPTTGATRAQVAAMLMRFCQTYGV